MLLFLPRSAPDEFFQLFFDYSKDIIPLPSDFHSFPQAEILIFVFLYLSSSSGCFLEFFF
jgi:hypothetical protein